MILDEIVAKRKIQLEREKEKISLKEMISRAEKESHERQSFKNALAREGLSVIAEVKKASPSKGLIQPDFDPAKIAAEYEKAGAAAISCLTEEHYFQGSSEYLADIRKQVKIPVLRKDFIFDEYQIYEAKAIGADAVLLIAACLTDSEFRPLYDLAKSLGLDILCEAHDEEETERLINMGCDIIGINNRNLKTFEVSLDNFSRLAEFARSRGANEAVFVCESGIKNNADMKYARENGADGVLVGETLMRSGLGGISECMKTLRAGL